MSLIMHHGVLMGGPIGPVPYWRLRITATDTLQVAASFGELQFRGTAGGPSLSTGGSATASSSFAGTTPANAFDGNVGTTWASASPGIPAWIRYNFAAPVMINQIALIARTANGNTFGQTPRDFVIESSPDASVWTPEWSVTGQTGWTIGQTRLFTRP